MNELKIHLDNRLQSLEISPALAARILTGTSPVKKRRLFRPLIVLLAVLCLSAVTVTAAVYGRWNRETYGFMTWDEYHAITPYASERPFFLEETDERYVIDFHLSLPRYENFTQEQQDLLYFYRNRTNDTHNGGVFSYTSLKDAKTELGIEYLQSKQLELEDTVSMRVSGPSSLYQVLARYTLRTPEEGCELFISALLNTSGESDFTTTTFLKQEPLIADHYVRHLSCDVTLLKWSDNQTIAFFTLDSIAYEISIRFATPPKDLFAASLDVLETLHH